MITPNANEFRRLWLSSFPSNSSDDTRKPHPPMDITDNFCAPPDMASNDRAVGGDNVVTSDGGADAGCQLLLRSHHHLLSGYVGVLRDEAVELSMSAGATRELAQALGVTVCSKGRSDVISDGRHVFVCAQVGSMRRFVA